MGVWGLSKPSVPLANVVGGPPVPPPPPLAGGAAPVMWPHWRLAAERGGCLQWAMAPP